MARLNFYVLSDHVQIAAGGTTTLSLECPQAFALRVYKIMVEQDGDFRINSITDKENNAYVKGEWHVTQLERLMQDQGPEPLFDLPANEKLTFALEDLSGAANDVWIGFWGVPIKPAEAKRFE